MFLEVIALSAEDVLVAAAAGADRVELVSDMESAGLSPSLQTVEEVLAISTIPVRVMVRCHNRDFSYPKEEVVELIRFIEDMRALPVEGFVVGGITQDDRVDEYLMDAICAVSGDKKITFHRAFDMLYDQEANLKLLQKYPQVDTILTSGGLQKPVDENRFHLAKLQSLTDKRILVGGGLTHENITSFLETDLTSFHVGSCVRRDHDVTKAIRQNEIERLRSVFQ